MTMEDDLLKLLIKDAVRSGMDEHYEKCHKELEARVDETRRFMWFSGGIAAVVGGLIGKAIGK